MDTASELPIGKFAGPEIVRKILDFSSSLSYPKHKQMEKTEFIKTPIVCITFYISLMMLSFLEARKKKWKKNSDST